MSNRLKKQRIREIRRHFEICSHDLLVHSVSNWPYVQVHPFADQLDVLARISRKPEDCQSADAWCLLNGDAALVTCATPRSLHIWGPGMWAHRDAQRPYMFHLTAILEAQSVTRSLFDSILTQFVKLGFPRHGRFDIHPGTTVQLTEFVTLE